MRADKALSRAIDEASKCIIVSLFYFELDSIPKQRNGKFSRVGHILCFWRKSNPTLAALIDKLSRSSALFMVNGVEIPNDLTDLSFWDGDSNFWKTIDFKVSREILILLKERGRCEYPISGALFSVNKLVVA